MLEALTPVRTTGNGDCLGMVSLIVSVVVRVTCLLNANGLIKFKEKMVAQIRVQNLGADCRWSDLLRITIINSVRDRRPCMI